MSLSCLACRKLRRSDLDPDLEPLDPQMERLGSATHRNWSGCLVWVPNERPWSGLPCSSAPRVPRKRLRKMASASAADLEMEVRVAAEAAAGANEPRLMRSGGMRRDWSFEDLKKSVLVVST